MKIYALGYYKADKSAVWVDVITANNSEEAWWKGYCWMSEMLGEEIQWLVEAETLEQAADYINRCLPDKYSTTGMIDAN
jgi:hypothetical protein